jgi:hypothetical protein
VEGIIIPEIKHEIREVESFSGGSERSRDNIKKRKRNLRDGESNPGLPRDRRGY